MSSITKSPLKSIGYYIEPENAYGVSVSGSVAYSSLRFSEANIETQLAMLDNMQGQQYIHGTLKKIPGQRRSKITIKSQMYGAPTALLSSATPGRHDHMDLLGTMMGFSHVSSGSAVASAATSSGSFAVTVGHGVRFPNGTVVGLLMSGALHCVPVLSKSTDTIIGAFGLPYLPATSVPVYNSHVVAPGQDPTGSLQFNLKGQNTNDNWVAVGAQGNFGLEAAQGQTPMISFDLMGSSWITGSNSEVLSRVNYGNPANIPPVFKDSKLFVYAITSGSAAPAPTNFKFKGMTFTPALTFADVGTAGGSENIADKVLTRNPAGQMTLQIQTYFENRTYWDARDATTEYGVFVQIGNQPRNTICLHFPRCQITNVVGGDMDGLSGQTIDFLVLDDTQTNLQLNESQDLVWAPYKLAVL